MTDMKKLILSYHMRKNDDKWLRFYNTTEI